MFCYNCGKELPENAVFCPFCGTQVGVPVNTVISESQENRPEEENGQSQETVSEEVTAVLEPDSAEEPPVQEEPVPEPEREIEEQPSGEDFEPEREIAPHTISSFVWSLVANELSIIPVLGLVFSIIAFVKSLKGRRIVKADPERYKLKGFLTADLIISIIALVGSIVGPILFASYFSVLKDIFNGSGPFSSTFV